MTPRWYERNTETMPAGAARFALDLPAYIARHDMKWGGADGPAAIWWQGAPMGNGDFGAMVYGPPENLTFVLGKTDLWARRNQRSYFTEESYEEVLRIYREGDRQAFDAIVARGRIEGAVTSSLTNAAFFRLHLAEPANFCEFEQVVSLYDATCRTRFDSVGQVRRMPFRTKWEVTTFVSQAHEALVIRARTTQGPLASFAWQLGRERDLSTPTCVPGVSDDLFWVEQELFKGDRYAVAAMQVGVPCALTKVRRSVFGESTADDACESTFYLAAASNRDSEDPLALACERVKAAADAGVEAVHAEHKRQWAGFWQRSQVYCADKAAERPWYVANYLAGSIIRPGRVSPGLQGMWARENIPAWSADFHGNINIQATYWGVFASNHMDLFEPYAELYRAMLPQGRRDAAEYFHAEGARLPHAGDIDGYEITGTPAFMLAVSFAPSGWIAQLYWWYWEHSQDKQYLAEVAYPILRDVAEFYRSMLAKMPKGADGKYDVGPTIFFEENCNTMESWGPNSTYEVGIMRMNLTEAATAARILGMDDALAAGWEQALADMPELSVSPEGIWEMWEGRGPMNREFPFAIFPDEVASAFHGSDYLREVARSTWDVFHKEKPYAWCGGIMVATAARMGDAEWALEGARDEGRETAPNGIIGGWDEAYVQADHGPGMTLALDSMMLQVLGGSIVLFPGMPARVDAGFNSLRAPGAVLVSSEQRGGAVRYATFYAVNGGTLSVLNPFSLAPFGTETTALRVRRQDNGEITYEGSHRLREPLAWSAEAGVVYVLEPVVEPFAEVTMVEPGAETAEDNDA